MAAERKELLIAIPIFSGITSLDAVGPYDVLTTLPNVRVVFVSHKPGLYQDARKFLSLQASHSFEDVPSPDVVIVPGGFGTRVLMKDQPILDWLKKVHETSLFTTSVCTGSLLLGAAGLLQGLEATTHWSALGILAQLGAKPTGARVVRQGKIITAAGVSSGIDMGIQLSALLSDELTAKAGQLIVEYDPQPPYDSGSVGKAGPEVVEKAMALLQAHRERNSELEANRFD